VTTARQDGKRLDHALAEWLPERLGRPISNAKIRKLIMAGAVYWNGRPVRIASKVLSSGVTIEIHVDIARLIEDSTSRDKTFELTPSRILFEDEDLLVIDKPPGLPAQPTLDKERDNLFAAVQRFLSRRHGIDRPYVGVHHRLDRDTSGVVLFTKSERVNAEIAKLFSGRHVVKVYQALTASSQRKLKQHWTIQNCLGKIASKSKRSVYGAVSAGGDFAETSFRVLEQHPRGVWIEAMPKTGRTHQIRVHLSEYGLPILGDDLYGSHSAAAPRLMLHACQLKFPHPITKSELIITSHLPDDFQQCLTGL
jgi:RluA family pseudouridine synthase